MTFLSDMIAPVDETTSPIPTNGPLPSRRRTIEGVTTAVASATWSETAIVTAAVEVAPEAGSAPATVCWMTWVMVRVTPEGACPSVASAVLGKKSA